LIDRPPTADLARLHTVERLGSAIDSLIESAFS
jgi:hypothetical protein